MSTPGFFELYPAARPALPAGDYTAHSSQNLTAHVPHDGPVTVPVDDTEFHLDIVAPRYVMPPDQILSTFPPATSEGDWRERLPQIVLKRRTLPWERNPTFNPQESTETAPPWLALVVLADGEGRLSTDVDTAQCVSAGVNLGSEADVSRGRYLEVTEDIVQKVFPCRDELDLLCHVRRVDLADTELALGDDDGYLAVVLSNRLPQPATPGTPAANGQPAVPATPLKYTAYLINLEHQLDRLLPTEPSPVLFFNAIETTQLVNEELLRPPPNASLDQIAMGIGPGSPLLNAGALAKNTRVQPRIDDEIVPYGPARGPEPATAAWASGPARQVAKQAHDLPIARGFKEKINSGVLVNLLDVLRFPVLVSWSFTCTGDGGFERLMNDLDVGLLGTLDPAADATSEPSIEIAPTGHIALQHRSRQGDAGPAWYRGPLTPQPTVRAEPVNGVLPLANAADELRKVVPDGREDLSQAALFEIGRLLTLNKPSLVSSLMAWRADLFGAARAREIADALAASVVSDIGVSAAGQRDSIEHLVRTKLVGVLTALAPDALAPAARDVTPPRVPDELADFSTDGVLAGLGLDPGAIAQSGKTFGVDGLAATPVSVGQASTAPIAGDKLALTMLNQRLGQRIDALVSSALKADLPKTEPVKPAKAKSGQGEPDQPDAPTKVKRNRRKDNLDRLISTAEAERGHRR